LAKIIAAREKTHPLFNTVLKAEIDFCGDTLVKRHLERCGRSILHDKIREAAATGDSDAIDLVLREYGSEVRRATLLEQQGTDRRKGLVSHGLDALDCRGGPALGGERSCD
jgi:hypothetical protein